MKYLALVPLAACLTVPEPPQPECTSNADCETALGEICSDGKCWGGPPPGMFAAIVSPPADRTGLTSVEVTTLVIPADGQLGDFQLATPVTITGRVEAFCVAPMICTGNSIAATLTITRPPLFAGGPGFKTVVLSKDGVPHGSTSFTASVPRQRDGDPDYVVTVVPDGNGDLPPSNGTASAAELAPPMRMSLAAHDSTDVGTLVLGSASSQVISGNLTDGAHALTKYRVVARGRLAQNAPVSEVSTVDYTANGQYSLTIADGAIGPLTIEARPYDSNVVAPTLLLGGLGVDSTTKTVAQPAYVGNRMQLTIPIEGLAENGEVVPVSGAHVTLTGTYEPPLGGGARAVLSVDATTGDDGLARLTVLDGASFSGTYLLRVVPTASSDQGVIYDQPYALGTTEPVRLPRRIELHGHIFDRAGKPAAKITVTASPSLRFMWSLDPTTQEFVSEIPAATGITTPAGDYLVWVDPYVGSVWGHYDLDFAAPKGVDAAAWTHADVEIPRMNQTDVLIGDETIPDTARLRGRLVDETITAVMGGDLSIFALVTDTSLCGMVGYAPQGCVIPATLLGRGTSDSDGIVELSLPR